MIVGGGPGGYAAALYGAAAGLDIGLVERDKVGGTCLHRGCIPAKELLETAAVHRTVGRAKDFGIEAGQPSLDFSVTQDRKQKVVDQLFKGLSGLLKRRKVTVYDGQGSLRDGHTVVVERDGEQTELEGDSVIVATGSLPRDLQGFDVDSELVVNSDQALFLERLPSSAAVIGGGAIGCEFASMMADLGTQVTVLEALPKIIPGADDDVTKVVAKSFEKRGIEIRTGVEVKGHEPGKSGTSVQFGDGESVDVDLVVVSIGRRPLSEEAGLDAAGVEVDDRGFVAVDELCRTSQDGVWAIGDVIATPQLAHVGFAEGILTIKQILGEDAVPIDHQRVPWCIYCHPEVAFAGLSESAAKDAGLEVVTSIHRFAGNGRAMIVGETEGLVKVIAEKEGDGAGRILGVHMVGPWVTEQLGQGYLAVNWEATAAEAAEYIQPHPTMSELFGESVMSLTGRGLHG